MRAWVGIKLTLAFLPNVSNFEIEMYSETASQLELELLNESPADEARLHRMVRQFREFGEETQVFGFGLPSGRSLPIYVNEFWTSKQRAAHSLHEVSYRACFKPQLPRFFIERLSEPGDLVYDPFMGRGTTPLEAGLLGRIPVGCDINPLSRLLVEPRFLVPKEGVVEARLAKIDLTADPGSFDDDLLVFYHPETLREIVNLRTYLCEREQQGEVDSIDRWIRMVATNRLTGHSPGLFLRLHASTQPGG